jgi:hypothetical protein
LVQIALHTVLKAGHEADYDAVHAEIPAAVAAKLHPDSYEGTDSGLPQLWTLGNQLGPDAP